MTTTIRCATAAVLAAAATACSIGDDVSRPEMRDDVRSSVQDTVEQLAGADLSPMRASGRYTTCEESGYEYRAGALLRAPGDLAAAIDTAEEVMTEDGWEVETSERGDAPFVNLSRGPLEASLKESQVERGALELGIDHDCVDGERDDTPSFDSEPIDLG